MSVADSPLARARAASPLLARHADRAEAARTLPPEAVKALAEAGLFRFVLPRELGGEEPDFTTAIEVWEEAARADGSAGWTLMANGSAAAAAAAFLSDEAVAAIFGDDPAATVGGQFAPRGSAHRDGDAWRVTGSYGFGSGTAHARYVAAGFIPLEDGRPRMAGNGLPEMHVGFVPHDAVRFTDGWHVMGLRGTGSYDYEVEDLRVPDGYSYLLFGREPRRGGETFRAMFRMGMMPLTGAGHAAFALGLGRRALDELRALAGTRQRLGDPTPLAGRITFQKDYARADAALHGARLLVMDTFGDALETSRRGDPVTPVQRARLRAAANLATEAAKKAADLAHERAGTVAIRDGSPLERLFRDMHTASQHAFIGEKVWTDAASVLLGQVEDVPSL